MQGEPAQPGQAFESSAVAGRRGGWMDGWLLYPLSIRAASGQPGGHLLTTVVPAAATAACKQLPGTATAPSSRCCTPQNATCDVHRANAASAKV